MSIRKPDHVSQLFAEYAFAGLLLAFGVLTMGGSYVEDIGWGEGGPGAGYFPFRIGAIIAIASVVVIVQTYLKRASLRGSFAGEGGLGRVASIFVPTALCALAIPYLGIYISSGLFLLYFLLRHGKVKPVRAIVVSFIIMASLYLVFENWLDVYMPKGPLEDLFSLI
jgi:hypothetical protein